MEKLIAFKLNLNCKGLWPQCGNKKLINGFLTITNLTNKSLMKPQYEKSKIEINRKGFFDNFTNPTRGNISEMVSKRVGTQIQWLVKKN